LSRTGQVQPCAIASSLPGLGGVSIWREHRSRPRTNRRACLTCCLQMAQES
jgi:hypothetical protein